MVSIEIIIFAITFISTMLVVLEVSGTKIKFRQNEQIRDILILIDLLLLIAFLVSLSS